MPGTMERRATNPRVVTVPERVGLDPAIEGVVDRLVVRFAGHVEPVAVRAVVVEVARRFTDARVATFVPTLVERQSRALLRDAAPDTETGGARAGRHR